MEEHITLLHEADLPTYTQQKRLSKAYKNPYMYMRKWFVETYPKPKAPTFEAYTEDWYATYKAERIKLTTDGYYRTLLERHLYPAWGNTPINEITTKTIQTYLNGKKHMAAKSLQEMLIVMRAILESARKDGIIQNNPADDKRIVVPSTKKTVREALPLEDIRSIAHSLHRLEPMDAYAAKVER